MIICRLILLRMRNAVDKCGRENQNFIYSVTFSPESIYFKFLSHVSLFLIVAMFTIFYLTFLIYFLYVRKMRPFLPAAQIGKGRYCTRHKYMLPAYSLGNRDIFGSLDMSRYVVVACCRPVFTLYIVLTFRMCYRQLHGSTYCITSECRWKEGLKPDRPVCLMSRFLASIMLALNWCLSRCLG
jgi:hypothetical protein